MGEKLEKPITTKTSFDDENEIIKYGMSEMQAYKKSMELFSLKNINLLEQNKNISLFGLFDGHNGAEISKYLSLNFSQFLSENKNFINGEYKQALKETFINLDSSFRAIEVQLELSKYSSKENSNFSELKLNEEENKNIYNFLQLFEPRNLEGANISEFCGSCGIVVLITEKSVFIANAGNSKCIPINTKNKIIKEKINKEHIVTDENEIKRLKLAYGFIEDENDNVEENIDNTNININTKEKIKFNPLNYCPLITTRGFGDLQYKDNKLIKQEDQYISVEPEIIEIPIEELGFLIITNYGTFGENNNNKLTIYEDKSKYLIDKINTKDNNKKISEIIENFFDEIIQEKEKSKEEEEEKNRINNMGCIIIEFKHDSNNTIVEVENEPEKDNKDTNDKAEKEQEKKNSDKNNKNEDDVEEEENS